MTQFNFLLYEFVGVFPKIYATSDILLPRCVKLELLLYSFKTISSLTQSHIIIVIKCGIPFYRVKA